MTTSVTRFLLVLLVITAIATPAIGVVWLIGSAVQDAQARACQLLPKTGKTSCLGQESLGIKE
jgi:hypothetical protein